MADLINQLIDLMSKDHESFLFTENNFSTKFVVETKGGFVSILNINI